MFNGPDDDLSRLWGPFQHLKLGPGVLGRTSAVAMAVLLVLAAAILAVPFLGGGLWMILLIAAAAVAFGVYYNRQAFTFAQKNPLQSVLEGAELVQAMQIEQSAKIPPPTIDLKAEPVANNSPMQVGRGENA